MIKKLKKSFLTVTMLSAFLVLLLLLGTVNLINYQQHRQQDIAVLQVLADNQGHFPMMGGFSGNFEASGESSGSIEPEGNSGRITVLQAPGTFGRSGAHFTAETPYESRYFSVTLEESGTVVSTDTTSIASITSEDAAALAQTLRASGRTSGKTDIYRYMSVETDDGEVMYVFLNCERSLSSVRSFLTASFAVMGAGLLILFLIAWLLSGYAIRPIVNSYTKQKSFITNAGHELKTPLAVISSCTDVIEIEQGESKWTQSIRNQINRLSSLTQELIALARMDEGNTLTLSDTCISDVVSETLAPYILLAEQKGISFTADIAPGIRRSSNAEALQKITGILADNAVKYATGPISLSLREASGHVFLRTDNPADSLSPGQQEVLFDRFYRGDGSRSSENPGYGLGLPLARSLAEALGGSIRAHSPDGKQLTITLRLP